LTNRIGDGGFLVLLSGLFFSRSFVEAKFPLVFALLILGTLLTKRAQYPFSTWLPLAIAAPTPISALVHSSTLVAAGIYLLLSNFRNVFSKPVSLCLLLLRGVTLVSRALYASLEQDAKKIIALSTLN